MKLYPPGKERPTLRHLDYALLMQIAKDYDSILEIGPGLSTLALIEAGVKRIVTLEHTDEWYEKAKEQFAEYPQVEIRRYKDEPEAISELTADEEFPVAFVDSPKGFDFKIPGVNGSRVRHKGMEDCSRLNTCLLALEHAPLVYLHDAYRPAERGTLGRLNQLGHTHQFILGPKSGLALIKRSKTWQKRERI